MENLIQVEREISELKAYQAAAAEQHKTIFQRLDKQDKMIESVQSLARSVDRLTSQQAETKSKVSSLCDTVEEIKSRPAKRWQGLVEKVIYTVAGAVIMFILSRIGL